MEICYFFLLNNKISYVLLFMGYEFNHHMKKKMSYTILMQ